MKISKLVIRSFLASAVLAVATAEAASPVILVYPPGGGTVCRIRGTNKSVSVNSTTGEISLKDSDLKSTLKCKSDETIVCDPTHFTSGGGSSQQQTAECKCVPNNPTPPVTGSKPQGAGQP